MIKSDIPGFLTADEILNEVMIDTYDDFGVMRKRYEHWLFRSWREINRDVIRTPRYVILPVSPSTNTVILPGDFLKHFFIGFVNECNKMIPLHIDQNLAPSIAIQDTRVHCSKCNEPDLCALMKVETVTEEIVLGNATYIKITNKILKSNGNYIEEITEPVPFYEGDILTKVTMETSVKTLCDLPAAPCGCVSVSNSNIDVLSKCGSLHALCLCQGGNGEKQKISSQFGNYNVYPKEGFIQMSNDCPLESILLGYISDGICRDGMYYFPDNCMEFLISSSYEKSILKKPNINMGEKLRASREATKQKKLVMRNVTSQNLSELVDMFEQMPRIPNYTQSPYGGTILR